MTTDHDSLDFAERMEQLSDRERELAIREQSVRSREAEARSRDAFEFADSLAKDNVIQSDDRDTVAQIMLSLPRDEPLSFSDQGETVTKPAAQLFREFLDSRRRDIGGDGTMRPRRRS